MIMNLIWWMVVGLIAGWAAGRIMKGGGYGVVMDIVLGIVGAVVGGRLVGMLGIHAGGFPGTIVVAIFGAVFLIWITRLLKRA
ncbi:MAG: GlsB/YeaQ/YmgE family stress response membrane protein [Candidatus Sulfotelmatobacter sp.]